MTGDKPDATALLVQARATLRQVLLPHLPEDQRYQVLMIANAVDIAARELRDGPAVAAARAAALAAQFPGSQEPSVDLLRRLAEQIRAGQCDGDRPLYALLQEDLRLRLGITNPKLLP